MSEVKIQAKSFLSAKVAHFTESVIREMTRQAMLYNAVNLSQGFPDFPAPREIKEAAQEAIAGDVNQYAITWGAKDLRDAIAKKPNRAIALSVNVTTSRALHLPPESSSESWSRGTPGPLTIM